MERCIGQTVLACTEMSKTRTGALIVFEREILLDDMVRSGTVLDATVSSELLKNIFFVKAPMVEVHSVNNRYLDSTVKMPRMYSFAEDAVKTRVQKAVSRGKVDVYIAVDASAADVAKVSVNRELAASYAAALRELSEVCGTEPKVTADQLARFPDVLTVSKEDEDLETVSADLCQVLDEALEAYNAMKSFCENLKLKKFRSCWVPRW